MLLFLTPWFTLHNQHRWHRSVVGEFVVVLCVKKIFLTLLLSQWEFIPWEIRVAFPQGKPAATVSRYSTLIDYKVHAGSFRVSVIHRTLKWTTESQFNLRKWSFLCVHVHTGGGWAHSNESAQRFWLRKTHNFVFCSRRDSNLGPFNLESDALPINEQPRHPSLTAPLTEISCWWIRRCHFCCCRVIVEGR